MSKLAPPHGGSKSEPLQVACDELEESRKKAQTLEKVTMT